MALHADEGLVFILSEGAGAADGTGQLSRHEVKYDQKRYFFFYFRCNKDNRQNNLFCLVRNALICTGHLVVFGIIRRMIFFYCH
jgi:hypothetical protein